MIFKVVTNEDGYPNLGCWNFNFVLLCTVQINFDLKYSSTCIWKRIISISGLILIAVFDNNYEITNYEINNLTIILQIIYFIL